MRRSSLRAGAFWRNGFDFPPDIPAEMAATAEVWDHGRVSEEEFVSAQRDKWC